RRRRRSYHVGIERIERDDDPARGVAGDRGDSRSRAGPGRGGSGPGRAEPARRGGPQGRPPRPPVDPARPTVRDGPRPEARPAAAAAVDRGRPALRGGTRTAPGAPAAAAQGAGAAHLPEVAAAHGQAGLPRRVDRPDPGARREAGAQISVMMAPRSGEFDWARELPPLGTWTNSGGSRSGPRSRPRGSISPPGRP